MAKTFIRDMTTVDENDENISATVRFRDGYSGPELWIKYSIADSSGERKGYTIKVSDLGTPEQRTGFKQLLRAGYDLALADLCEDI